MKLVSQVELLLVSCNDPLEYFTKITKVVNQKANIDINPYWLIYASIMTMEEIRKNEVVKENGRCLSPNNIYFSTSFIDRTLSKCIVFIAQVVFKILKTFERISLNVNDPT